LYLAQDNDLVVVACRSRCPAPDAARLRDTAALATETARVGLDGDAALALRRLGGRDLLQTYVHALHARPHSDYDPQVALRGPRTRFRADRADTLQRMADNGLPVLDLMEGRRLPPGSADLRALPGHSLLLARQRAHALASAMSGQPRATPLPVRQHDLAPAESELQALLGMSRAPVTDLATWMRNAAAIAAATLGHLPAEDLDAAWIAPAWIDYAAQPEPVRAVLDLYAAAATRDAADMLGLSRARRAGPAPAPVPGAPAAGPRGAAAGARLG